MAQKTSKTFFRMIPPLNTDYGEAGHAFDALLAEPDNVRDCAWPPDPAQIRIPKLVEGFSHSTMSMINAISGSIHADSA
jgi:hypothetical protein